jgi:hypothetical protein
MFRVEWREEREERMALIIRRILQFSTMRSSGAFFLLLLEALRN